ncbi:hypothetical protein HD554DRAFT_2280573 [Boletus coccyginus]|nr:hypothetical protein HD554DRAFT_2280573 [Boletus coccyginus]
MRLVSHAAPLKRLVPVHPSTSNRTYEDKAPGGIYLRIWVGLFTTLSLSDCRGEVACGVHIYELVMIPVTVFDAVPCSHQLNRGGGMSTCQRGQRCGREHGALFFSAIMCTGFYSVTCMQTAFYYVNYRNRDSLPMKSFVAALWVLDSVHEGFATAGAYKYIMADPTSEWSPLNGIPELTIQMLFTALVAVPAQGFFVYRIYVFSGKNIVAPLIWVPLALYQLGETSHILGELKSNRIRSKYQCVPAFTYGECSIMWISSSLLYKLHFALINVLFALSYQLAGLSVFREKSFIDITTSALSVAAVVDLLIAILSIFLLFRKGIATGLSSDAHIVQRLTVFAINTGIWTAVFALMTAILLRLSPLTFLSSVFGVPLCSVYCNTLLANLNVRAYIRNATHMNVESGVCDGSKIDLQSREAKSVRSSEHSDHHGSVMFPETVTESENIELHGF